MLAFGLIAALITLSVLAVTLRPLLRPAARPVGGRDADIAVYRDQLAEIDRDIARGTLDAAEGERTRLEVSRRLLAADRAAAGAAPAGAAPRAVSMTAAAVTALVLLGGGGALYWALGAPGLPDLPHATRDLAAEARAMRPSQAEAEARFGNPAGNGANVSQDYLALVEKLRAAAKAKPNDLRGQELLARHEARLGFFKPAYEAKRRVVALKGDKAEAADFAELAELMILAAGGYVSPEAEEPLSMAARLDPSSLRVRYYSGLLLAQTGRPELAYRIWAKLLAEGPADAPWVAIVRQQIAEVARMAGIETGALPGPTPQQMEDADGADEETRQQMIRQMVERLSNRLDAEGGSAEEWARLIRARVVLGEVDKAKAALAAAQKAHAGDDAALATIAAAARAAGIAE